MVKVQSQQMDRQNKEAFILILIDFGPMRPR